jgi:dTDP-4-dehydrorhamnose 3,5-epimerase
MLEIKETGIEGLKEIHPDVFKDDRGFFTEAYNSQALREKGITTEFVQDNLSFSNRGVIRGLHLQYPPHAQCKLVRVVVGRVLDIVVDIRPESKTFGKIFECELSGEKNNALLVPEGFAHGFAALEDSYFLYKCSSFYSPGYEGGIRWDDSELNIDWKIKNPTISEKDRKLPSFSEFRSKLGG